MSPERTVGIDLRMWGHPGIGRYIRELTAALFKLEDPARFVLLTYQADEADVHARLPGAVLERGRSRIYSVSEQAELSAFSGRVGLLHVPHFNAPFLCKAKLVATVHDLIYLKESRFSGSFLGKAYVRALLTGVERNASAVIAVSDFTRRDLETAFPKTAGKVQVIHEAASEIFCRAAHAQPEHLRFGISEEYVLFVGSLKAHKNLPVLLDAFETLVRDKKTGAQLVIVGKKDPKEEALFRRAAGSEFVRYLGPRSDEELAHLYRGARALVIPSLWEGFGLPAVEAMACGTPVLCSDRASLPEVVGDAGLLFDPERVDRLAELLYNVLIDRDLRNTLSQKGLQRAKCFSWENAASQTLKLYEKVSG